MSMHKNTKDITGSTFGKLVVTGFSHYRKKPSGKNEGMWKLVCECGNKSVMTKSNAKNATSCGCARKTNRVTTETLKERLALVAGDNIMLSKVQYVKSNIKINLVCKLHGDFYKLPFKALEGHLCPSCGREGANRTPFGEFVIRANTIHNNKYVYSEEEYLKINGNGKHMVITCKEHGNFVQKPMKHLTGQTTCKGCRGIVHDTNSFIKKAVEVHGSRYSYKYSEYAAGKDHLTITCKKHGKFLQLPNSHLSGSGCPMCGSGGFKPRLEGYLYVLRISTTAEDVYKIGITNLTVNERFSAKELKNIEVLYIERFSVGLNAYTKEQKLLNKLEKFKYLGEPLLRRGNTEIITINPITYLKEEFNGTKSKSMESSPAPSSERL